MRGTARRSWLAMGFSPGEMLFVFGVLGVLTTLAARGVPRRVTVMRMRTRVTRSWLALLGSVMAAAAPARDVEIGRLRAWDMPGYTLVAADGFDPGDVVRNMAQADLVATKLLARAPKPVTTPMEVWLVPRPLWNRYLAPGDAIAGEFVPRRFANYLVINGDLPSGFENDGLKHEYTHYFLRSQVGGIYPLWFDEGLAVLIGNADIHGSRVTFKPAPGPSVVGWVEMSRLFELDKSSREYLENPQTQFVHFESYAIVQRGLIGEPKFGNKMFAYLTAVDRLVPPAEAVTRSFGMSFDELDRNMRAYMTRRNVTIGNLRIDPPPVTKLPAGRVLERVEAILKLARLTLDSGARPDNARELVNAAQALAPGASAAVLSLRLTVRDRDDDEMLKRAATFDAVDDAAALRAAGVALFERVREPDRTISAQTREKYERLAFGLLNRGMRAGDVDPEAAWAFGMLAARLGSAVSPALERLAAARERMPGHPDLAEATARALEASNQAEAMMPFLLEAVRNTSSPGQRLWAAQRIKELRKQERENAPL